EEIPILITITLAIGAYSLSKKKAIVKGLTAAQTLGSVTVIASDKTVTITENTMQVSHILDGRELYESGQKTKLNFLKSAVLATGNLEVEQRFSWEYRDPMEVSILKYSYLYSFVMIPYETCIEAIIWMFASLLIIPIAVPVNMGVTYPPSPIIN
ncbi:ATPase, P-type, ATPase-associated region domain protein, partial [mine drainage metagenome]